MQYLTNLEYLERYTEIETVRLTDAARTGQVDDEKLSTAIADMTEEANAYLAGRYVLPIVTPPELLKGIVADLTRERLHGTKAGAEITRRADRARKLLSDIAAGRASIPAPVAGTAPAEGPSGSPVSANDRRARVFTDGALADFTSLTGSRYGGTVFDGPRNW
jgi:phage gp36-like protein